MVARRLGLGVRGPRAGVSPLPDARRRLGGRPHGHLARRRSARFPWRCSGRERVAATCASAARPARAGPGPWLARLPRGIHRARVRRFRHRARAKRGHRAAGAALRGRGSRDARPRARRRDARGLRAGGGRHALPRRGGRLSPGGRARDPDRPRLGMLLSGQRLHGGTRLRASIRVVRPDRGVRRALRESLHARILPGRVRGRAPVAWAVGGGRECAPGVGRGLRMLAPRLDGGSARRPCGAATTAGTAGRGDGAARKVGRIARCAALPRTPRARPGRDARVRRAAGAIAAAASRPSQARPRAGARAPDPRARGARRARRGTHGTGSVAGGRAADRNAADARLRRPCGRGALCRERRPRAGPVAARRRGRSIRAERVAVRGGASKDRARFLPSCAWAYGYGGARGSPGLRGAARTRGER